MTTTGYTPSKIERQITQPARRELPWHVLGSQDPESKSPKTVSEALTRYGLDYNVTLESVFASGDGSGGLLEAADFRATVRDFPNGERDLIGIVGKRFRPIQNPDAFGFADYLVSEFGATISGGCDYGKGARSLLSLSLGKRQVLGGRDEVDHYLLITNAHDGSAALKVCVTPIRLACTNALTGIFADAKGHGQAWSFAHTPKAEKRLEAAQVSIRNAVAFVDEFEAAAEAMLDREMNRKQFNEFITRLIPTPRNASEKTQENAAIRRDEIRGLFNGETNEKIFGTAWAAYNAVTEYVDWVRPTRGDEILARAEGALDGPYVRMKARAWSLLAPR